MLPEADAAAMAEQVGVEYGRQLAAQMAPAESQRSARNALHAVADALTAHGFAAHAEARGGALTIISDHCPFGPAAQQHPVICAVDRGMVRGHARMAVRRDPPRDGGVEGDGRRPLRDPRLSAGRHRARHAWASPA